MTPLELAVATVADTPAADAQLYVLLSIAHSLEALVAEAQSFRQLISDWTGYPISVGVVNR